MRDNARTAAAAPRSGARRSRRDLQAFNAGLLAYLDASPTPFHAVAEARRALVAAGYAELDEADAWRLAPGGRHFVVRNDSSLIAFDLGAGSEPYGVVDDPLRTAHAVRGLGQPHSGAHNILHSPRNSSGSGSIGRSYTMYQWHGLQMHDQHGRGTVLVPRPCCGRAHCFNMRIIDRSLNCGWPGITTPFRVAAPWMNDVSGATPAIYSPNSDAKVSRTLAPGSML